MATWAMLKREKMKAQALQSRFGSYKRFAEDADRPVPRDGAYYHIEPSDHLEPVTRNGAMVQRLAPGQAQGLSRSIGRVGKAGRVAFRGTYGNGERRTASLLTADVYCTATELLRG